jgi:fumarate hydratase class I
MTRVPDYGRLAEAVGATITAAATRLPPDVTKALEHALAIEEDAASRSALAFIVDNIRLSAEAVSPICQDTGYPTCVVEIPRWYDKDKVAEIIRQELRRATQGAVMRPNAVHPLTQKNSGDNTGIGFPALSFDETASDVLTLKLMLKGGGSENVSCQYRLPHAPLKAGRDLEGIRKVVLDGIFEAQGFGCSPGIVGVAIGADRAQGYALAKKQLFRKLDDVSEDPVMAGVEQTVLRQANELGIGAMGFGGRTTVLGVKATWAHRHPASFFVTLAYGCWALRRKTLRLAPDNVTIEE